MTGRTDALVEALKTLCAGEPRLTVAVAESLTCGQLQAAIGAVSGVSAFFLGGITAYAVEQKVRHLGVDPAEALPCQGVSPAVARQMAGGVSVVRGGCGRGDHGFCRAESCTRLHGADGLLCGGVPVGGEWPRRAGGEAGGTGGASRRDAAGDAGRRRPRGIGGVARCRGGVADAKGLYSMRAVKRFSSRLGCGAARASLRAGPDESSRTSKTARP
ncbi:MAG: hypothetical protein D6781_03935 [Verrucomicrobia bacterium]|nr:MAG: hypothetical protein D6781_03935 [Verrucomicrobiota bacterium]